VSVAELRPAEARARLAELAVVDVRGAHEYHGPLGRVAGARLVPLPELAARLAELPSQRPLLLVCRSGARSGRACEQLAALGVGPAYNLAGGMIAWNDAGLPVEETKPASLVALLDQVVAWFAQVGASQPEAARAALRQGLAERGLSLEPATRESVGGAIEQAEATLRARGEPPDLALSVGCFRRWLADL
jgi:rhodanese-related sulfurtransferase